MEMRLRAKKTSVNSQCPLKTLTRVVAGTAEAEAEAGAEAAVVGRETIGKRASRVRIRWHDSSCFFGKSRYALGKVRRRSGEVRFVSKGEKWGARLPSALCECWQRDGGGIGGGKSDGASRTAVAGGSEGRGTGGAKGEAALGHHRRRRAQFSDLPWRRWGSGLRGSEEF
uniref:Uncharacterized protein n=1 Tax=Vespula pensylvanica TaxID=30213 RepID=A0A834KBM9_VESPE|nr:hypothetical protein H0235_015230 [Vespula pensylvanica]